MVKNARAKSEKNISRARCNKTFSGGGGGTVSGGGSISAGFIYGFGAQGSGSAGIIKDGLEIYLATYFEGGFSIGGLGLYYNAVTSPSGTPPVFFGAYVGVGIGLSGTNATFSGATALTGPFDKINVDAGLNFSVGSSLAFSGTTIASGATPNGKWGVGYGVDAAYYPTNTILALNILLVNLCG